MLLTDQWFKFQTIEKANAIRYYWIFFGEKRENINISQLMEKFTIQRIQSKDTQQKIGTLLTLKNLPKRYQSRNLPPIKMHRREN